MGSDVKMMSEPGGEGQAMLLLPCYKLQADLVAPGGHCHVEAIVHAGFGRLLLQVGEENTRHQAMGEPSPRGVTAKCLR